MWRSVVIFLSYTTVALSTKSYIDIGGFICPRQENIIGDCLKEVLNDYIPQLSIGLPQYNIPSCEPLLVKSLSVRQSAGPMVVNATFTNVQVRGPSSMRVKNVEITKDHRLVVDLYIPDLKMNGNYKMKGALLMIPVEANGDFTAKYHAINVTVTVQLGRKEVQNGADVLSCEKLDVSFWPGDVSLDMKNLLENDTELSKTMNNFLNENSKSLSENLQIPIQDALRDFLKPLADQVFATLPADDILNLSK